MLSAALAAACVLAGGGCATLGARGPVPESVASCRQLSQQGVAAMEHGRWDEAQQLLARAVETCPNNVEARRNYAEALWQRGAQREAIAQLEAAMQTSQDDATMIARAGEMHRTTRNLEAASRLAERALRANPRLADAWALRGRVMHDYGQAQQALADLQRALSFAPDDRQLLLEVAELYRQRNQPQRALSTLQHLADCYPPGEEPQRVLYLSGLAYSALGRYDDAVESLYAASVRSDPTAPILCSLAEAEYRAGRTDAAAANLRQALAIDGQYGPSLALAQRLYATSQARQPDDPRLQR